MKEVIIFLLIAFIFVNVDGSNNRKDSFDIHATKRKLDDNANNSDIDSNLTDIYSNSTNATNITDEDISNSTNTTNVTDEESNSFEDNSNKTNETSEKESNETEEVSNITNDELSEEVTNSTNETNQEEVNSTDERENATNNELSDGVSNETEEASQNGTNITDEDTNRTNDLSEEISNETNDEDSQNVTNSTDEEVNGTNVEFSEEVSNETSENGTNATDEDLNTTSIDQSEEVSNETNEASENGTNTTDEEVNGTNVEFSEEVSNATNEVNENGTNITDEETSSTNQEQSEDVSNEANKTSDNVFSDEVDHKTNENNKTEPSQELPEEPIEEEISIEEAFKRADILLSFRQISGFQFNQDYHYILFKFYCIAIQHLQIGTTVHFRVYLISDDEIKDTELSNATCILEKDTQNDGEQTQFEFNCQIAGLKDNKNYNSFEIYDSIDVAGVPKDKTLLNPIKTKKAIENGELIDFSLEENAKKYPNYYRAEFFDGPISENGEFRIAGRATNKTDADIHFDLDLTYPANQITKCTLPKVTEIGRVYITCAFKKPISDYIVFEQQIIRDGLKELFNMKGLRSTEKFYWGKQIPIEEAEKKANSTLSFRQVKGFHFNPINHFITFNFFGITTQKLYLGYYFFFDVYLILLDGTRDTKLSKAICSLDKEVEPTKQAQADFNCNITGLDNDKQYQSFEIYDSEEIVGIPENKTLLDPVKTEQAINSSELPDYSLEENKEKLPIYFKTESIEENYDDKGKFKILGTVEEEIPSEIDFTMELLYPGYHKANCKIPKSQPGTVEIVCTLENIFYGEFVIIEQQILRSGPIEITVTSKKSSKELDWAKDTTEKESEVISSEIPDTTKNGTNESDTIIPDTPTQKPEANNTSEEITFEEADKRSKVVISFRQINKFMYDSNVITFYIYTLIRDYLKKGTEIILFVNLMNKKGEREDKVKKSICKLENDTNVAEGDSAQADFKCTIEDLEPDKEYYSLRFNSSDDVTGVPDDETLLDPILTKNSIEKKQILDYSIEENKSPENIPATFIPDSIEKSTCDSNGIFLIKGSLSKKIDNELSFKIPLTFPDGIAADCTLERKEAGPNAISCQVDRKIDNSKIVFEQVIIKDGSKEILNIGGISSEETISCINGLLTEAEKKTDINISFRQVSHLKFNGINAFSFFLIALFSKNMDPGSTITLKIIVLVNGIKKEKNVQCTLRNNVVVSRGIPSQGIFDCEKIFEKDEEEEYKGINFNDAESIKISSNNSDIGGIDEVEGNLSPLATDEAINKTKARKNANETLTDLAECIDYSEQEEIISPPILDIINIENFDRHCPKGKLTLKGKFSSQIREEITFDLPLSYPQLEIKCKVNEANINEEVEIPCKIQKKFKLVEELVIEPRLVKKKHKEVLYVRPGMLQINPKTVCEDYNMINYLRTQRRKNAKFSFLQLSHFLPKGPKPNFFMALARTSQEVDFSSFTLKPIKIIVKIIRINTLRQLDNEAKEEDLEANCAIQNKAKEASGFNCSTEVNENDDIKDMELDQDQENEIAGLPEEAHPTNFPTLDYSIPENLAIINQLQKLNIKEINGAGCEENGIYTIKGEIKGLKNNSIFEIPFSSPDSSGLCSFKNINGDEVTIECNNKEEFTTSHIIFEPSIIKDSDGKPLFILNDNRTNFEPFACSISENSVLPPNSTIDENKGSTSTKYYKYDRNSESSGLNGGAITAIVLSIIAVIAITGGLIFYFKRNTKPPNQVVMASTLDHINESPSQNDV